MAPRPARLFPALVAALASLGACASLPGALHLSSSTGPTASSGKDPGAFAPMSAGPDEPDPRDAAATAPIPEGQFAAPVAATTADWQAQPETEARRNADGVLDRPGPHVESTQADPICDARHNHCLHGNSWFVSDFTDKPGRAELAFRFENQFYTWANVELLSNYGGYFAYQTAPATVENTHVGAVIAIYQGDPRGSAPDTAARARDAMYWRIGKVAAVDAAAGTFRFEHGAGGQPLAVARVATAAQPMP
jgi:hypothetical protein